MLVLSGNIENELFSKCEYQCKFCVVALLLHDP